VVNVLKLPQSQLIACACCLAICFRASATAYFVSNSGDNSGNGSSGSPWATLQYAADHVAAGDTVIATAGTYAGFQVTTSGTASQRITFTAQPGVTINAVNPHTPDGIDVELASYITIDGFRLVGSGNPNTTRAGIRVVGDGFTNTNSFSQGVIVQNNTADSWGKWGIFTGFASDIVIQNNVAANSAQQHGIYVSNSADNPIIRHNLIYGNAASGIHMNGDINTGNTSLPGVDGVISHAIVESNIIHDNGGGSAFTTGGGSGINADGVQESDFQNNLLYNNHASGIALFRIDGGGGSIGNKIANNTVINASNARWVLEINGGSTDNTAFNNIFWNNNSSSARGSIDITSDSYIRFLSDYNLLDPRIAMDGDAMTLAQWQAFSSNDRHSSSLTQAQMQALFRDYITNDFRLADDSAAIDAGIDNLFNNSQFQFAPLEDLLGTLRPHGAGFDMGAYESTVPEPGAMTIVLGLGCAAFLFGRPLGK
jgi:hypothetical protein